MNILFCLENYYPHVGGVEVVFKNLCEGLVRRGHSVNVVTHKVKGTKPFETIEGVNVHRVACFNSRYFFTFFAIPLVTKLARRADIVHTTTYNGAFPAFIASILTRKKCILTVHEVWVNRWQKLTCMGTLSSTLHNFLEKCIYRLRFDHYVCVSGSTRRDLLRHVKRPSRVIYNGIDYSFWSPTKHKNLRKSLGLDGKYILLYTGRPGVSKGLEYLLKSLPLLNIPSFHLVAIVSNNASYAKRRKYILSLARKLGVSSRVTFLNSVDYGKLASYVKTADCVIVPSLYEGFGFAVAESCAMGSVVVASNVASIPEVISGKYVLVHPKNPQSLAKGITKAYRGDYITTKLKKFTQKKNIEEHLKLYGEML